MGTNLGDKDQNLRKALDEIETRIGKILKRSAIYETAAWGKTDQAPFLNMVIMLKSKLTPVQILHKIQALEKEMGRIRVEKWKERIIDIDILYINGLVVHTAELTVPHPEISNRRFTLAPLNEITPDFIHPVLGKTQSQLLQECPDTLPVTKIEEKNS